MDNPLDRRNIFSNRWIKLEISFSTCDFWAILWFY